MHIGIVGAAIAALENTFDDPDPFAGPILDRLYSAMNEKPPAKSPRAKASDAEQSDARGETSAKMNPAFDVWLENKLHKMFDSVAAEPLPAELVKLLEELDKKTSDGDKNDSKS